MVAIAGLRLDRKRALESISAKPLTSVTMSDNAALFDGSKVERMSGGGHTKEVRTVLLSKGLTPVPMTGNGMVFAAIRCHRVSQDVKSEVVGLFYIHPIGRVIQVFQESYTLISC